MVVPDRRLPLLEPSGERSGDQLTEQRVLAQLLPLLIGGMILSASKKQIQENPERIKMVVDMHKKAVDYAMAHPNEIVERRRSRG